MENINHPDAGIEAAHLHETLIHVDKEVQMADKELQMAQEQLSVARKFDPDGLPLREMLYFSALQRLNNLKRAAQKPYFTRIDFIEEGNTDKRKYYIGRYGVLDSDTLEVKVVDWRSPAANLYYSGQVGPMNYATPEGEMRGELTLKRQLSIEARQLRTIFDTGVVSQDQYLQAVLGEASGVRLREIVTTIQAEQNYVIRHPLNVPLVVQGVAGSGKTTIALHRVAYLMYAYQDKLTPESMMILAPNPLFLDYISGVLPDLGVERVNQTTFERLFVGWLGKLAPKIVPMYTPDQLWKLDADQRSRATQIARCKGSLDMQRRVENWLEAYKQNFVPRGDALFGPVKLYSEEQLRKILLEDLSPFALDRRLKEFKKQLQRRTKQAAESVVKWLHDECDRRIAHLVAQPMDDDLRRARARKLYESRDQRASETRKQVASFVKEFMGRFPSTEPLDCYRRFWQDMQSGNDPSLQLAAQHTLDGLSGRPKAVETEDMAALAILAMGLVELPKLDIRHIIIDEAQDLSPLELRWLQLISRSAPMTVVGDLMQGISAWRGIHDWTELAEGVFEGKAVQHHLVTSYRNTVEIMEFALRVARNRPTPGQKEAKPVLRHGKKPELTRYANKKDQLNTIVQTVRKWQAEGHATIALIAHDEKEARNLASKLKEDLDIRFVSAQDENYNQGVMAFAAGSVKGLEFDGVIMADVGVNSFEDMEMDARLLYVCLTRPLHRLSCLYSGKLTPLLKDEI